MRTILIGLALASLAISPASAAPPNTIPLAMNGPWVANYDNDSCQLLASFGSGNEAIIARFVRYAPGDSFDLLLTGKPLKRSGPIVELKIGFGPGRSVLERSAMAGTQGEMPLLVFSSLRLDGWSLPPDEPGTVPPVISAEQESGITNFTIQLSRAKAYRLELGPMRRPMAEMRKCMDSLLAHWGYDPKIVATMSRPVTPIRNPGNWLSSSDYPSKALREGSLGLVQFRLDIDESGQVQGCHILARTNPDEFADLTCRLIRRRAKFQPALNVEGKPVKGFYINKVRFQIPY